MSLDFVKTVLYAPDLNAVTVALVLAVSALLGAVHALGPGHGKSLMAAYLVGSKGRIRDAFVLALALTFSHVASVIVVAFVALLVTNIFWPEWISKWLALFSGIGILAIGFWLFLKRYRDLQRARVAASSSGPTAGAQAPVARLTQQRRHGNTRHSHHINGQVGNSAYDNSLDGALSTWGAIVLGFTGGIIPCPKAIVILLLAISLHRIALGIVIIVVFSVGIAATLVVLGISVLRAGELVTRKFESRRLSLVPLVGALTVVGLGAFVTARAVIVL